MELGINFLDKKDSIKKASNNYNRKIKFRLLSFEKISLMWKKMKRDALERKLESQKEKFVSIGFDEREVNGPNRQKTEEKILKKTKAIAKLESKLTFLKIGKYNSEKFINSRAIKLKDTMMNNLIFNRDCQYSLKEEVANQIMEEDYIDDEALRKALEIEMEKIGNKVQEIMEETSNTETNISMQGVSSDSAASSIDSEFSQKVVIDINEIKNIIDQTKEEQKADKVNNFINDDGTYRLKKEDIDEEFRITRFDSKKPSFEEDSYKEENQPIVEPFSVETERKIPTVELPKKAIAEIVDKKHNFPSVSESAVVVQEEKDDVEGVLNRELPIVVPERKSPEQQIINDEYVEPTQEIITFPGTDVLDKNIDPLITKVNILQAEQVAIKKRAEEEETRAATINKQYQETIERFIEFADLLEADCNRNMQTVEIKKAEADEKVEKINAMLEMMSSMDSQISEVRKGK